jgi:hypothetical protein
MAPHVGGQNACGTGIVHSPDADMRFPRWLQRELTITGIGEAATELSAKR